MSWFRLSLRGEVRSVRPDPSTSSGEGQATLRNDEATDPGIDIYIPPETESVKTSFTERFPQTVGPVRWVQQLLAKRQMLEVTKGIVAKVELLPKAPDTSIRYFFDNDLPSLVSISQKYPTLVQQILNESLENSPTRKLSEPWYRLVQVACGDTRAILPALDGLC